MTVHDNTYDLSVGRALYVQHRVMNQWEQCEDWETMRGEDMNDDLWRHVGIN